MTRRWTGSTAATPTWAAVAYDEAVPSAGTGPSALTTVDWLDEIHRLFPKETIERLERDAVERYEIHEVVTDPEVLARIEPNPPCCARYCAPST